MSVLAVAVVNGQSSVVDLNDAGWRALSDGNNDRASALFLEALTLRPSDPVLLLGAGAAAHAQGRQQDAIARLKRALEVRPDLTPASRLLAQIAYTEGDVDLAIRTYERALKLAPGDRTLSAELDAFRKDADVHRTFDERRYDRFRVMFEGRAEESLAARATTVLDSAFFRIGTTLGEYPPNTIVAVLYTEKQFRDITRAPEWSGGEYDGRIRIPASGASLKPELFDRVLTHELTHAVVAGIVPAGVPGWLNEGLAQHFDGSDAQAALRRMKAAGRSIPLASLEGGFARLPVSDVQIAYDESLLAANVLFDRPGFGWVRLLHRLADGQPFADALPSFGFSYPDLEQPFRK
jgi:tetratricopeptide (TPR) repeat protein